jgi:biopolymer transport protein ExbD
MANLKQRDYVSRPLPIIQIISLIDILFINLSFFMAMFLRFNFESELNISVPQAASSTQNTAASQDIIINIWKDGTVVVNQKKMVPKDLGDMLGKASKLFPSQAVVLRADQDTPHKYVVHVLDECAKAKIWNVSFATSGGA